MSTLFSNNSEGGFRLRSMEVFNWGTFHGKVYKLNTNGQTSLLTGANGSGKTTLIDALLTLLVPSHKRFYNQSSGADNKKERDENSYFWGYYGKTYSELDERSKTEQLRNKADNPYSVLLACFQNASTLHTITLVQVRWYSGGIIKRSFIVAPYPLNINEHFGVGHFDLKGEWKKKLARQFPKTDFFDSFKEYAARFSDIFGLKEKALSIFNQTVGIKVLGDLTQFIRLQMLEDPEADEQFKSLHDHYTDLLTSHKAIQKDEKQLELLNPVIENKGKLQLLQNNLSLLSFVQEQLPFFLGKIEHNLLVAYISKIEQEINSARKEKEGIEENIEKDEEERDQLITQKANLNIDSQVQLLNKDINAEIKDRDTKKEYFNNYINLAEKIELQTDLTELSFLENLDKIGQLINSSKQRGASGKFADEIVFRQRNGKTIMCKPPRPYPPKTATQIANQERFKRANDFAKAAIKDPVKKAYYKSIAKPTQTAFNAAFQDAYNKPKVEVVVKEKITIKVKAKHAVVKVTVGTGKAILNNGHWEYKLIKTPFTVTVHDIAGNICTQEIKI